MPKVASSIQRNIIKSYLIPAKFNPLKEWGANFKSQIGCAIKVNENLRMSIYLDKRLVEFDRRITRFTRRLRLSEFLLRQKTFEKPMVIGHVLGSRGEKWNVHSEPVGPGKLGLIVYTDKGKAIAAGTAWLYRSGKFLARVSTLYPGITNRVEWDFGITATAEQTPDGPSAKVEARVGAKC